MNIEFKDFSQPQLATYFGNNPIINNCKQRFITAITNETFYPSDTFERFMGSIRLEKPEYVIVSGHKKAFYQRMLNEYNNERKQDGKNPKYIKFLVLAEYKGSNYLGVWANKNVIELTPFEEEYLLINFNYQGFDYDPILTLPLSENNQKYIQEQFNTEKEVKEIKIQSLVAETNDLYHFKYNKHFFFIKKEKNQVTPMDVEISNIDVDFSHYEKICKWDEWKDNNYKFRNHQKNGIKFLLARKKGFIFDTTGVGKTLQAVVASLEANFKKALVVTIVDDKKKWQDNFGWFDTEAEIILSKKEIQDNGQKVDIINYEILKKYKKDLLNQKYDLIIVDECHKARNPNSQQSKILNKLITQKQVQYVFGLTATSIEYNIHIYNIFSVLNVGIRGFIPDSNTNRYQSYPLYRNFMMRYCQAWEMPLPNGRVRIIPGQNKTSSGDKEYLNANSLELAQRIRYYYLRRTHKDVEGYPEKHRFPLKLELTADQRKHYENTKKEILKELRKQDSGKGAEKLVLSIKMRQLTSELTVNHSVNFLKQRLKKGDKALVFTQFEEEFDMFKKELKDKAYWINSAKYKAWGKKENSEIVELFKKDTEKNILFGNIQTLGTAHNIPDANIILINTPNWNYGEHFQAEGRAWRLNSKSAVNVYYWIFEDTEAEVVFERSESKKSNTEIIFRKY